MAGLPPLNDWSGCEQPSKSFASSCFNLLGYSGLAVPRGTTAPPFVRCCTPGASLDQRLR
ncbi:hypothetical protein [Candidatus Viridilinea mediisalina]|uniref:hypothetical protein n=1 Tax=Candidatus Viridilinea mediisalina TaxID=2024553 RepID=UPI000F592992|nr:hypothetical protein [Candidatus Viridilinea mediisalina]